MVSLGIVEWKRTPSQYVAILQSVERFDPTSIRPIAKKNGETILGGVLRGTDQNDWYALAYDRSEWDFDEARLQAHKTLDRYRDEHQHSY